MSINKKSLMNLGAKYVACTKEDVIPDRDMFIPQYSVVWTKMDIADAPKDAIVTWFVADGFTIKSARFRLGTVTIIDQI
jgi:hypothetical protein